MYFLNLLKNSDNSIKSFSFSKESSINNISIIDNLYELFSDENKSSLENSSLQEIIYSLNNLSFLFSNNNNRFL